jgi:hypothetical protein
VFSGHCRTISPDPLLTTVRQPIEATGQAAVDLLPDRRGGVTPDEPPFEPELGSGLDRSNARSLNRFLRSSLTFLRVRASPPG